MTTRLSPTVLLVATIAVPLLAACGSDDETLDAEALDGRTFVATEFEPDGIVDGSEISVSFADGSVVVMAGCNTQRGGYAIDGDVLKVEMMASTMMACDDALMRQDAALVELITSSPTLTLNDDTLTMASGDTTLTVSAR